MSHTTKYTHILSCDRCDKTNVQETDSRDLELPANWRTCPLAAASDSNNRITFIRPTHWSLLCGRCVTDYLNFLENKAPATGLHAANA